MDILFYCFFVVFGLIIGSFLNVVIYRFNTGKTLGGRSHCLVCGRMLKWHDLVPVLSFIFLGGRCRKCKTKISWQYPIVESLTALMFVGLFHRFNLFFYVNIWEFVGLFAYYASLFSLLLIITVYDIRHKIIPDKLALIFGILAFLGLFFVYNGFIYLHLPMWSEILSGFVLSVPFALLWFVSEGRWMGLGDAKLSIGLGFMLGLSSVLPAAMIAFWSGAIVGIALIFFKKIRGLKSEIPFAPFLVFGTALAFFLDIGYLLYSFS